MSCKAVAVYKTETFTLPAYIQSPGRTSVIWQKKKFKFLYLLLDGDLTSTWHRCLLSNPAFIQYYNQNATSCQPVGWSCEEPHCRRVALISKVGSLPLLFRQLIFSNVFQSDYSQSKLDNDRLETGCFPPDSMQLQTDHQFFEITWRSAVPCLLCWQCHWFEKRSERVTEDASG